MKKQKKCMENIKSPHAHFISLWYFTVSLHWLYVYFTISLVDNACTLEIEGHIDRTFTIIQPYAN